MLRIMLPGVRTARAVAASHVVDVGVTIAVDIGVTVEIVVYIDIDVIVSPSAAPAPTAPPGRSHCHTNAERDCARGNYRSRRNRRIVNRRIRINRRAIYDRWIVGRYIYNLWICLFHHDDRLVFNYLGLDLLLLARLQGTGALGFFTHALHGIHDIALLREKSVPE